MWKFLDEINDIMDFRQEVRPKNIKIVIMKENEFE